MKIDKRFIINVVLVLCISSVIVAFSGRGFFQRLELSGLDVLFRLRGASSYNPNIVLIEIDDANIAKIGRWPWKRQWHGAITRALKDLGARSIYFDVLFSETSTNADDRIFAAAIEEAGNVYLPFAFRERSVDIETALFPIKEFSEHSKGRGSINVYPAIDGSLRNVPLFFRTEEGVYPHVALKVAMDYGGLEIEKIEQDRLILDGRQNEVEIPLVNENEMIINWMGKWKETFTHYSFLDILAMYKEVLDGKETSLNSLPLKNSICLVAVTAIGLQDIKPMSLEPEYPGIGTLATVISNVLDEKFISKSPRWINGFLIYLLSIIPFLFISGEKPLRGIIFVALVGILFFCVAIILFRRGLWINYAVPLFSLFVSYLSVATFHFVHISVERQRLFKLAVTDELTGLSNIRYFMMIVRTEVLLARTNPEKKFCIVMTDVDHFKKFNDTYGHAIGDLVLKEISSVLKTSVRASDVVARYGGEEMIILLRSTTLDAGMNVSEKVRKNVEEHDAVEEGKTYKATISLGVSIFNEEDDEKTVIKRADAALYVAKESGRNQVKTVEFDEEGKEN